MIMHLLYEQGFGFVVFSLGGVNCIFPYEFNYIMVSEMTHGESGLGRSKTHFSSSQAELLLQNHFSLFLTLVLFS